jgi:D-serine deaminase-like pyridoxal phosphate-dependent protein
MLKKLSLPFSLAAVAVLAACASRTQPVPTAVVVTPPQPTTVVAVPGGGVAPTAAPALRAGTGLIEAIAPVPQWSSSTGSAQPSAMRRVGIRMDGGTMQFIDTDAPSLRVGDRVQITADGYIRNPGQQ